MKKNIQFFLLLALLLLTMISCSGNQSVPNSDSTFEVNGINYNKIDSNKVEVTNKITSYSPYSNDYSGSVTIPATVTYHGTTYSVTSIGYGAFDHCYGLTNINIPKSVTNIDRYAFRGCSSLTNINIPNSVTSIGDEAFDGCSSLTSINIPNSVTDITNSAFSCCSSLENISVASNNTNYDSRNNCNAIIETATNTLIAGCMNTAIPNSVTTIGDEAFSNCSSLTSINIPNSVTTIGDMAFSGCSGLTNIHIPNSVTSIGDHTFYSCSSLTSISVASDNPKYDSRNNCNAIIETTTNTLIAGCMNTTIPKSVTSINEEFLDCPSLKDVYCYATTPPRCENSCYINYSATLHVPAASLAAYHKAPVWSKFKKIVGDADATNGYRNQSR